MPYIERGDRPLNLERFVPKTPGELSYGFAVLIRRYLSGKEITFQLLAEVMGALSGLDKEFYRRVVVPYEKTKKFINGDVF